MVAQQQQCLQFFCILRCVNTFSVVASDIRKSNMWTSCFPCEKCREIRFFFVLFVDKMCAVFDRIRTHHLKIYTFRWKFCTWAPPRINWRPPTNLTSSTKKKHHSTFWLPGKQMNELKCQQSRCEIFCWTFNVAAALGKSVYEVHFLMLCSTGKKVRRVFAL